jgi:hypothetical protein
MVNEFMSDISASRNFSCRFLLFLFFLSFAKPAWSDVVKVDDISPSQWGKEWEKKQQPLISSNSNSAILSRCAIVQKKEESVSALPISPEDGRVLEEWVKDYHPDRGTIVVETKDVGGEPPF